MKTKTKQPNKEQVTLDKIVKRQAMNWISWREAEKKEEAIGGMGGFFNAGLIHEDQKDRVGMRWDDYVAKTKQKLQAGQS